MQLNDLLNIEGIDPTEVLVMRHRPTEPGLRKVLPWLAAERPDVYNAYQQAQVPKAESALLRAGYLASFIGHEAGRALYVGLYKVGNHKTLTRKKYWSIPANKEMKSFGMTGFDLRGRTSVLWFEMELTDFYAHWKGKLIVDWPGGERSWHRWASRNEFFVQSILEDSLLDEEMPNWRELVLTWDELKVLPNNWKTALSEWRGIYYIWDASDGKGYVGSAYGNDNLLGRWLNYAKSGHGGNKRLKKRKPSNFRFNILQRVSPDMAADNVIRLENTWKERLHTREIGLNEN